MAIQAANTVFNILAGIGIVLGCVILVYAITILFDKYSRLCQNSETYVLTPEELVERQHASNLTKRAGLAGILPEERVRIYRNFFGQRALSYKPEENADDENKTKKVAVSKEPKNDDVEAQKVKATRATNTVKTSEDQELQDLCMMEHDEATCPICLSEYVEGDKVITGSSCSHKFHLECCMQWLEKGNDHCAYCRNDMMTPDEMTQAARNELGDARVDKITRINHMAAQRLEEYETALAAGADNTEISRQFASGTMPGDQQRALSESNSTNGTSNPNEIVDV